MNQVRQHASLTMIDTPPLLTAPDALTIAEQVEGVVLVVRPETSAVTLIEVRRRLDAAGARLLGYVLNRSGSRRGAHQDGGNGNGDGHESAGTAMELTDRDGPMQLPGHAKEPEAEEAGRRGQRTEQPSAWEDGWEGPDEYDGKLSGQAVAEVPATRGQSNGR
jgi:hypothetical protein